MKMLYRHTEAVLQLIRPILRPGISLLTLVFGLSGLSLATPLATQISLGGAHSCVVTGSGGAKCWGGNYSGQVGDNTVTTRRVPTDVYSLATGVSEIAGGGNHTCVATSSGNVRCWGYNMTGQVGFGTNDADPSPAPSVSALDTYNNAKVATGGAHSCALTTGGGVFCWGDNYYTQLGVITANGNLTTTLYSRIALQKYGSGYKAITAGANHTCALTTAGAVKCWGDNQYWQAGDWSTVAGSGLDSGVLAIAAGSNHTCAITSVGGVKCWGSNFNGQVGNGFIGNGSGVGVVRPVDVVGLTSGVIAIEAAYNHSCALTTSGGVKCWGTNTQGQLGDGTTVQRLTPVDVVGLTSGVAKIAAGGFEGQNTAASSGHTCAITNNFLGGTVKCWGDNRNGQLGDNTLTYSTQPVDVIGLSPPDTSAPSVPANLVATNTYTQQIDLSWSPSTDNVAVANYQLYRDGVLKATFNGTASLDSSLTPNTQYTYTVAACDGSGNCSAQSVPLVTKTLPIPDITKPSVPTGLVAVVAGPTQINLTWNAATDNVGVTVYQLYRGGALYYSTAGLSYSDTGALPQTTYIYTVTSCDAAGNCSDPSSLASATTPALPDSQAPTVPTSLVASAINATQINLTWVASTDNVGVTSYAVYRGATLAGTVAGGITHYSDYGLTSNTAYSYTVKACDAVLNCSTASNTASATTPVPPDTQAPTVPTNLSAVAAGTTRISLTWTAATDNIGVVSYRVSRDGAVQAVLGNVTSFSDSGMLAGTIHQYSVSACDSSGNCSVQSGTTWATTSPATVPDAPTIGSATPKDYSAVISFYAPAVDGGAAISGYSVLCNPGGVVTPGVGSPITVTGLTKGTSYTCQVRAANSVGSGPYSAASNIVVPTGPSVPGTPPVPTAVAGNGLATVQVTSPSNNGGSPILGYSVISNPAGGTDLNNNSTTSVHTVTGLTNGVGYTFTVTARNALGTSLASSPSASVVPKTVPRAPIMGLAVTGSGSATLSFQAPMDNGGSAITGYTVISNPAGGIDAQAGTMALSRTITGLSDGMTYTFTAVATNVVGTGAASSASNTVVPRSVPSAPIMRAATPYNASAVVSFLPPSFNGGATVSGFTVVSNPSGGIDSAAGSTASEHRIINLVNGTAYTFTVTATNAVGTGPASSPSASVTPLVSATVSDPPTTVTATTGNANATVSFTPPTMIGGSAITGYSVSSYPVGGVDSAVGTLSTSHLVTGLTNSVAYTFTVTATNVQGTSLSSIPSNSVTPRSAITAPSAPRGVSASAENGAATVSFLVADTTGGAAILGYTVTSSPASGTDVHAGTLATSHRISGLVNGTTYTFTVIASNSAGTSPASLPSAGVVPMGVPGAPTVTTVTAGNTSAMVAFSAPSNNGGSAIMGYTVTSIPPGGVDLGAGSLATTRNITGLLNGTSYRFVVTAGNVVGAGPGSAPSTSVTPKGVPGVPTISNIQAGNASLTLTFLPPASDGGDPITGYYVSCTSSGTGSAAAQTVIGSPVNLSSLTVGQPYACTVTAINGQGMGLASVTSNFVTPTASVGNAACGPSHGTIFTSRPTDGLCTTGTPTEVVGGGPWTWSCTGGTGTRNDHCIAFPPTQPIYKISTIAGNGTSGYSGDGGPATAASINGPQSLAADSDGNLYIADTNNSKLRKVDPIGVISTVATIPSIWAVTTRLDGTVLVPFNGSINSYGSNGFMTVIGLNSYGFGSATGIATANTGDIYVVNRTNHLVVRVANDGTAGLMAGNGTSARKDPAQTSRSICPGEGGLAIDATVSPWGVAADRIGNLFIADYECSRIWKVSINGEISTVVGNGDVYASYESGLPATQTAFYSRSVAVDLLENLYYPMSGEVRKVGDDGISRTIAGGGVVDAPASDGGLALNASLRVVEAVAVDIYGNVFITDRDTKLVSKLAPQYAPGIPILSGITAEAGQLSVSFLPPGSTGSTPISSYAAICSPAAGGPSTRVNGTSSPIVVGSLTDGVAYTCQVTAMNSVGEGSPSASSIAATPGALTNGTCGATHNLPLSSTPSSQLCTTGNATTVTGVGPWFWGCIGTNGGSNSSCLAPVSPPPLVAPVITAVGAGDSSVVLSFNGAAQDNGAPVLGYLVNCSSVGAGASVTTYGVDTPMGISGLTNGQTYTCTATASNNDGLGIVSAPSAQFVPLSSNMSYISLNTGSLSFGDQNIGTTSAAKTITLTNTGKTTLNISNIQLNIGVFAVTHTCGSSLAAHASCYVYVSFSPVASGGQTGAITFSSTAVNSPLVTVSGNGAANAPSCTLSAMPARIPPGRPTTLTPTCAPAATSYAWTGGTCQGTTASTCTVTPAATTTYGFTGTNSYGSSTASATVTVKAVDLTPILMLLLD